MELCCNESIVLPNKYVLLGEEEMTYLDGGVSLKVSRNYLDKSTCLSVAGKYTSSTGLGKERLAKEIYAHAVMYYASNKAFLTFPALLFNPMGLVAAAAVTPALLYIRSHSNPIDLGGDSAFRVKVYSAIWNVL